MDWEYDGDVGIRHGGYYFSARADDEETVDIVQVLPLSDEGGPDNLFRIRVGLVSLEDSQELANARKCSGIGDGTSDLRLDVNAVLTYKGMSAIDEDWVLRIGPVDEFWDGQGANPEPDKILRANTSLRKWLQREYLHPEPAPVPTMR